MIGWIGLGNMGKPMCMNLMKAGYEVIVNTRRKETVEDLLAMGAHWGEHAADVAAKADCVFTMLPNGQTVKQVVSGTNGLAEGWSEGKILVDMSTISSFDSAIVNDVILEKGGKYLRCPVTGSTGPARMGTLGLLISGPEDVLEEVDDLLGFLGNKKYYLGEQEESRVMKIALNTMVGNMTQLLAEAVTLAERGGIDVEKCMEVIAGSAVGNLVIQSKVNLVNTGVYDPAFSVKMMLKDFDLALDSARQYKASLPVTSLVRQFYEETVACGQENEDYAVLVQRMEKNIGIER